MLSAIQTAPAHCNVPQPPAAQEAPAQGTAANGATVTGQPGAQPQLAAQANQSKTDGTSQPENKPIAERQASNTTNGDNSTSVKPEQQTDSTSSKSEDTSKTSFFDGAANLLNHTKSMFTGSDTLVAPEAKKDNPKSETPSKAGQPSASATANGADKTEPQASSTKTEPQASLAGADKPVETSAQASLAGADKPVEISAQASLAGADKPVETSAQASLAGADKPVETSAQASSEGVVDVDNSKTENNNMDSLLERMEELTETQNKLHKLLGKSSDSALASLAPIPEDFESKALEHNELLKQYETKLVESEKQMQKLEMVCGKSLAMAEENQKMVMSIQEKYEAIQSDNKQFRDQVIASTQEQLERDQTLLNDLKQYN